MGYENTCCKTMGLDLWMESFDLEFVGNALTNYLSYNFSSSTFVLQTNLWIAN